jgi:hypothetical protein
MENVSITPIAAFIFLSVRYFGSVGSRIAEA